MNMKWNDVNLLFGNNLRKFRKSQRLSQEDFAFRVKIDKTYYGRLERGEHSITLETCLKISTYLGISLMDLFRDLPL